MDGTSCPSLPQCKRLGNRPERTSLSRPHLWPCEGRPRREKGRRRPPRGKLRSLNQPPAPHASPGPEASSGRRAGTILTEGGGPDGAGTKSTGRPPTAGAGPPAARPPVARAPRASAAPCARPAARAPGAARCPRPQAGAPLSPYPCSERPPPGGPARWPPRPPAPAPGPAPLPAACACAPTPPTRSGWLSSAAVTAARPSGAALRPLPLITPVAHRGPRHRPRSAQDLGCLWRCLSEKPHWAARSAALSSAWAGRRGHNSRTGTVAAGKWSRPELRESAPERSGGRCGQLKEARRVPTRREGRSQ